MRIGGNREARKRSRNAVDKVFGRRRRKGQKRQAAQRQPADTPARQGEFLFGFSLATNFRRRFARGRSGAKGLTMAVADLIRKFIVVYCFLLSC